MNSNEELSADSRAAQQQPVFVNRVAVKVPPFWKGDPTIWFAQVEAQFDLAGITNDTTKYNHIVCAVDTEILTQVSDIIQSPPTEGKYQTLKSRLTELYTDSNEKKLRKLLSELELGDKKPSMLLHEMQRLGGSALSTQLLQTLWLQRLPVTTQSCLTVSNGTLEELAKLADKVAEIEIQRTVVSTVSDSTAELLKTLINEVSELKIYNQRSRDQVRQGGHRSRNTSKFRTKSRTRSRGRWVQGDNGFCYYHDNFGVKAKKCVEPCKYVDYKGHSENQ